MKNRFKLMLTAVVLTCAGACAEGVADADQCTLIWECGIERYGVLCEPGLGDQLDCTCEKDYSEVGSCEKAGICADAQTYQEAEGSDREVALLNLKSYTVACCGFSVSTDASVCSLSTE